MLYDELRKLLGPYDNPNSLTSKPLTSAEELIITIDDNGNFWVDGKQLPLNQVKQKVVVHEKQFHKAPTLNPNPNITYEAFITKAKEIQVSIDSLQKDFATKYYKQPLDQLSQDKQEKIRNNYPSIKLSM